MADRYTDIGQKQSDALSDISKAPSLRAHGGDVRYIDAKITVPAGVSTSDVIFLARLPAGARLLPGLSSVDYADPGDAFTCKVGDSGDDDRYGAALALGGSAGRKRLDEAGTKGDAFLNPYKLPTEGWVYLIPTTVTNAVEHAQVWHLAYTLG